MSDTDRTVEEQWFRQNERQMIEAAARARQERERERAARETAEQRRQLKERHWMKCPKCGHDLEAQDHTGVEIDRCTFCEGLWFDAGELEQLFSRKVGEQRGVFRKLLGL
jgi:hypothetical protein